MARKTPTSSVSRRYRSASCSDSRLVGDPGSDREPTPGNSEPDVGDITDWSDGESTPGESDPDIRDIAGSRSDSEPAPGGSDLDLWGVAGSCSNREPTRGESEPGIPDVTGFCLDREPTPPEADLWGFAGFRSDREPPWGESEPRAGSSGWCRAPGFSVVMAPHRTFLPYLKGCFHSCEGLAS
ncbi:hypothetical protein Aple_047490 [Acrocarpospora pleiomorpha]|uniref:Uncharacterized protein n=1 Tax=Acrocarpospora pleiomorpha TaxID=90975 RepID=A0A5M3XLV7_9ACTN|nr:hypothetical protein Aple_047490 [Acrocarpospora pleiomorpha]